MDYTNNPGTNKHPDSSNFEFLYELYGELPYANSTAVAITNGGDDTTVKSGWQIPDWLISTWQTVTEEVANYQTNKMNDLSNKYSGADQNLRLLHASPYGLVYSINIGEGLEIRVQVLLEKEPTDIESHIEGDPYDHN